MTIMADELDLLTVQEENLKEMTISQIRRRAGSVDLPFTGKCYNCGEALDAENYCDRECVQDHRRRMDAERRKFGMRPSVLFDPT